MTYGLLDKPLIGSLPTVQAPLPMGLGFSRNFGADSKVDEQNRRTLQGLQQNAQQREQILAEVERDLMEIESYRKEKEAAMRSRSYRIALNNLEKLNPDSFSLTKAVFYVENAFFDGQLREEALVQSLAEKTALVRRILKGENLNEKDNLALNYGIQKLFSRQPINTKNVIKVAATVPTFHYDFEDFRGEKDYRKMFVSKALITGAGQCHSLPLVYLLIAEQLGAKAQLALAPQHSFIQFKDRNGKTLNFETTNGNLVSTSWLTQSGYITSLALQKKTYLSALSSKQLYAQMLADLMLGYISKSGYDGFVEQIKNKVLQIDPNNMVALIVDANIKKLTAREKINAAGKPPVEKLPEYKDAYHAYLAMQQAQEKVEGLGYQDMPEEAYQRWLKSIDAEKKKQDNQRSPDRIKQQIKK